jgi:hypothetical protein
MSAVVAYTNYSCASSIETLVVLTLVVPALLRPNIRWHRLHLIASDGTTRESQSSTTRNQPNETLHYKFGEKFTDTQKKGVVHSAIRDFQEQRVEFGCRTVPSRIERNSALGLPTVARWVLRFLRRTAHDEKRDLHTHSHSITQFSHS